MRIYSGMWQPDSGHTCLGKLNICLVIFSDQDIFETSLSNFFRRQPQGQRSEEGPAQPKSTSMENDGKFSKSCEKSCAVCTEKWRKLHQLKSFKSILLKPSSMRFRGRHGFIFALIGLSSDLFSSFLRVKFLKKILFQGGSKRGETGGRQLGAGRGLVTSEVGLQIQ